MIKTKKPKVIRKSLIRKKFYRPKRFINHFIINLDFYAILLGLTFNSILTEFFLDNLTRVISIFVATSNMHFLLDVKPGHEYIILNAYHIFREKINIQRRT